MYHVKGKRERANLKDRLKVSLTKFFNMLNILMGIVFNTISELHTLQTAILIREKKETIGKTIACFS